jgi:hypothetical protein
MKTVYISLPDIIEELRTLGKAKVTGTYFIVSDTQHSANIGIEKGRIVSLQCRLRFGEKAIPLLARIKNGTCRFEETSSFIRRVDFGDNEEVFRRILSAREQDSDLDSSLALDSLDSEDIEQLTLSQLSDKQQKAIEDILVDELGPMGSIVSDSIENCSGLSEIMEIVKQEVDSTDVINSVAKKIKKALKH